MPRFVFSCCLALLALLVYSAPTKADRFRPQVTESGLSTPVRRSSGSRCPTCNTGGLGGLYLLMPNQVATTAAAYPTLHWYQPTLGENRVEVNVYHYDSVQQQLSPLLEASMVVSGEPGIASLPLPAAMGMPPLTVGETYYWEVLFFCEPDDCRAEYRVQGWVQRVEIDAATVQQLVEASLSEQVAIAAEAGLWLEAVTGLTTLLRQQPDDPELQRRWTALLDSVGLAELADEPLLP